MKDKVGWFEGSWLSEEELSIPIFNQGLHLGDGIFETILILNGKPRFLKAHLTRWNRSAEILGMNIPPNEDFLNPIIQNGIQKISLEENTGLLRINWARKNEFTQNNNKKLTHYFWLELNNYQPSFEVISTMISVDEYRNANSQISKCKTFSYIQSLQAKREARINGFDDALLLSTNGKICCGATSNIIVRRNNELITPYLNTGCLPGIMREKALSNGILKEAEIDSRPIKNDEWLLINSLSCRPIKLINDFTLNPFRNVQSLWTSLLQLDND
tara:strand:- start:1096 stop:1914 length:819 start_codon:yes stop_codon:yes gene_type:complete